MKKKTYREHKEFAQRQGISSTAEWVSITRINKLYYQFPRKAFPNEFEGWDIFFGRTPKEEAPVKEKTPPLEKVYYAFSEVREVVAELDIQNPTEYRRKYQQDPMLPFSPQDYYGDEYDPVTFFELTCVPVEKYILILEEHRIKTIDGARRLAVRLPCLRLPRNPIIYYQGDSSKKFREYHAQFYKRSTSEPNTSDLDWWFEERRWRQINGMQERRYPRK